MDDRGILKMRQRSPIFLALVLGVLATNAWADGWEGKHPVPFNCAAPFAGAYLGVATGYAHQRVEATNENPAAGTTFGRKFSDSEGGFTGGGYTGYNWQRCGQRFVFGIEADFNYINTSPTATSVEVFPAGTDTTTLESSMDWFGTLRGRMGFVINDRTLLYATGGLAYGKADHKLNESCISCQAGLVLGPVAVSHSDTKAGWTVGGGAEYLHDSHWALRAEALYVDLGSTTHTDTVSPPGGGTGTEIVKWDDQFWVARLGLAYKFGARADALPLK
jgi:outer membrane immunogenic protein